VVNSGEIILIVEKFFSLCSFFGLNIEYREVVREQTRWLNTEGEEVARRAEKMARPR